MLRLRSEFVPEKVRRSLGGPFFLRPHICIATPSFFVVLLREICSATVAGGHVVFAGSLLPSLGLV